MHIPYKTNQVRAHNVVNGILLRKSETQQERGQTGLFFISSQTFPAERCACATIELTSGNDHAILFQGDIIAEMGKKSKVPTRHRFFFKRPWP